MYFNPTLLIILGLLGVLITSCDTPTSKTKDTPTGKTKKDSTIQNQFPIKYVSDQILKFNKPYTLPDGNIINQDTFDIYSMTNKSLDTVWIRTKTPTHMDTTYGYLLNKTIKTVCLSSIGFDYCNDSAKLLPNEKLLFFGVFYKHNDSVVVKFRFKIKKRNIVKDTIIKKKMLLKDGCFIEDNKFWASYE